MAPVVDVNAHPEILSALTRLGRTEDLRFSPSGRRLAVAGFGQNVIYVFGIDIDIAGAGAQIAVTINGLTEVLCPSLHQPHGLSFLDDDTIVVANRAAEVPILQLPPTVPGIRRISLDAVQTLHTDDVHGLKSPGCVAAYSLAPDLYEILVCNNYADIVSRHVVDGQDGYRVLSSETLVQSGLELPDGATLSDDRRWLAVSNHNTHSVLLYRYSAALGPNTPPDGELENVTFPHGLSFSADGGHLVVADAGTPYVHAFARGDADWDGVRQPVATTRIMDDATYLIGHYNYQEGGPKGLDLDPSMRLIAVSSDYQPLGFFDARLLVPGICTGPRGSHQRDGAPESTRSALIRALRASTDLSIEAAALENSVADRDSRIADLEEQAAGLAARSDELDAIVASSNDRLADFEAAAAACAAHVAELEAHVVAIESENASGLAWMQAELDSARAAEAYHRHVVADRDEQLEAIRSSTSWRITAVPRSLLAAVLRGRRR